MSPKISIRKSYVLIEPKAGIDYREIQRGVARLFYVDRIPNRNRIWLFREGPQKMSAEALVKLKDMIRDNYPDDTKVNKTAIVVSSDLQSNVAESFVQIAQELPQSFRVFSNLAEAEAWVKK